MQLFDLRLALDSLQEGEPIGVGRQDRARIFEELRIALRVAWAAKVLDAWRASSPCGSRRETSERTGGSLETRCELRLYPGTIGERLFSNSSAEAARFEIAVAVFPTLPEAERNRLGACP